MAFLLNLLILLFQVVKSQPFTGPSFRARFRFHRDRFDIWPNFRSKVDQKRSKRWTTISTRRSSTPARRRPFQSSSTRTIWTTLRTRTTSILNRWAYLKLFFIWAKPDLFVYFRPFLNSMANKVQTLTILKRRLCAWDSIPGLQDGRRRQIRWALAAQNT